MKRTIILISSFMLMLLCQNSFAQQYLCEQSAAELYTVMPVSGLTLRAAPSLTANKLLAVPHGKTVSICREEQLHKDLIDGHEGQWVRAFYRGESGYMFDAFLEAQPSIQVIQTDGWVGEYLPEHGSYLGLYADIENPFNPTFMIKAYRHEYDTLTIEDGGEFINAHHTNEEHPLFIFSGIDIRNDNNIPGRSFDHKFLFPGESVHLGTDKATFYVYAKGNVLVNKDGSDPSPFSKIKNYELWVRRLAGDQVEDKLLYKMDIPSWYGEGYEGGVHLHWIGDLDGDGELDLLLTTSNHYSCWEVNFFLSSKAERGHFFRQVSRYQDCGC